MHKNDQIQHLVFFHIIYQNQSHFSNIWTIALKTWKLFSLKICRNSYPPKNWKTVTIIQYEFSIEICFQSCQIFSIFKHLHLQIFFLIGTYRKANTFYSVLTFSWRHNGNRKRILFDGCIMLNIKIRICW